jgi:hypothetical protein
VSDADRLVRVELLALPVQLHRATTEHLDGLVRELQLLAVDPTDTPTRLVTLGRRLRRQSQPVMGIITTEANDAAARGEDAVDLAHDVPTEASELCRTVGDLLDEAERYCRDGGLLTLAAAPAMSAYRSWFLGEFVRQVDGGDPVPWPRSPAAVALGEPASGR